MDKNLSKSVKILKSKQIVIAAMFYFEQVSAFSMLINKSVIYIFLVETIPKMVSTKNM